MVAMPTGYKLVISRSLGMHAWHLLPRAHAQGVKQSSVVVVVVVVVVVGTKIARSRVLGVYACYKHNQSIDIGEKLV